MNDMNPVLPPKLDVTLNEYYAAQAPDPAFADQLEGLLRRRHPGRINPPQRSRFLSLQTRSTFMQTLRTRPLLAFLAALLAVLALTGAVYALARLSGFIPGFGFTAPDGQVYVLSEAAESTAGDISLQARRAVNDGSRFWVEVSASGLVEDSHNFPQVFVLLADGEKIPCQIGGDSQSSAAETRMSFLFPALGGYPEEVTLLVEGLGGQNFSLPLKLRPAKAGEVIPAPEEGQAPLESENRNGVRLVIDSVAVDSRKTILQVSLKYDRPNTWIGGPWNVTLSDAAGAVYPLDDVTPDTMTGGDTHVYQTIAFRGGEDLRLTLVSFPPSDTLPMFIDLAEDAPSFNFDPGKNPTAGQTWDLNQALSAAGFDLKVVGVTLTDEPGLLFEVEPGAGVTGVMFYSPDPLLEGSTGGVPVQSGNISSGLTFSKIPDHPIELRLMRIYYQAQGNWQLKWQPPLAPTAAADAPTPEPAPTLILQPSATPAVSNPTLLEVQQLAQKFDAPFQQGADWVHVVQETVSNPRAGQTFPPPYIKNEQWLEVDPEGYILRSVWLDFSDSGQNLQRSATVGNYSVNFTTGDSGFNDGIRYRFSLDTLTRDLSAAAGYGTRVLREEGLCDNGDPCLLITLLDSFATPVQNAGEPQAFSGGGRRVWIDRQTGQQVKTQSFWLLEDGSEEIVSTSTYALVEKLATPPQEITDLLAGVVIP